MRDVAIVGFAQTKHKRSYEGISEVELLAPVLREVQENAGLKKDDIDFVCSGSSDYLAGQAFSFVMTLDAYGPWPPITESHVDMDGAWALYEAWVKLQIGEIDTALIYCYAKSSPGDLPMVMTRQLDPYIPWIGMYWSSRNTTVITRPASARRAPSSTRAVMSEAPWPAGNGTSQRTGLEGQACARTGPASRNSIHAQALRIDVATLDLAIAARQVLAAAGDRLHLRLGDLLLDLVQSVLRLADAVMRGSAGVVALQAVVRALGAAFVTSAVHALLTPGTARNARSTTQSSIVFSSIGVRSGLSRT